MRVIGALLALVLVAAVPAAAEQTLTLAEAVELARRQNPTLLAARGEAKAAAAAAKGARALSNPEIIIAPTVAGEGGSDSAAIISQPLEINGQRQARARVAAGEAEAARAAAAAVERELLRDVQQAYWEAVLAQAVVDLNRANVEVAGAIHRAARRQVEVGAAPGSHAMKTEVELGRATQELVAAESELAKARAALNTLLGRAPETEFALSDALHFAPLAIPEGLLPAARARRPEVAEARALVAARRGEISAAVALRRPDLAVQARREEFGGPAGVGVSLFLPFIDWGSARQEKRRAEAEAEAQGQRVAAIENEVGLQVESALRDARRAEAQVRGYEGGILAQSERLAQMAQRGYEAGATGYLDVLEAQRTLRSVRTDYYSALADHLQARAQLEWAAGYDLSELQGETQ